MKHLSTIQSEFLKSSANTIFPVENIIVGGNQLPDYNKCGLNCKHLSSNKDECYLFRAKVENLQRVKLCVSYTEGTN